MCDIFSRDTLEDACAPLLMAAMEPVYSVLRETDTHPDAVHDVVMVGGSSRLLAVRSSLALHSHPEALTFAIASERNVE